MIIIIAAIGKNNELGKDNKLLWHLPSDLKFFKEKTLGKTIVMGKNTFDSLPKILPNRKSVVLSHIELNLPSDVIVFYDFNELVNYVKNVEDDVYIIGGAQMYKQFLELSDMMYLTEIDKTYDADVFFPNFDKKEWESNCLKEVEENDVKFKHMQYVKKRNLK